MTVRNTFFFYLFTLSLRWGKQSNKVKKESITYTARCLFLHFARLGISSRFLKPWFLTRPTNKLNFPTCFLPKLSLRPPFLTYEGAQTFSVVRFFLREVYRRRKQVLLYLSVSLSPAHWTYTYTLQQIRIFSTSGPGFFKTLQLDTCGPNSFYHKSAGRSRKMHKFQGTKYFSSLSGRAVWAENGISTPENSKLRSQSPVSCDLNLKHYNFYCFIYLFFV